MSGTRVYYDLNNLRSLSDDELRQLSPRECAAASEQADQNIVRILQDIDAHFAAATRTVTDRLIPAVEAYGGSSKRSWDSVKLWKYFFETAAGLRLHEDTALPDSPERRAETANNDEATAYGGAEGDETAKYRRTRHTNASGSPSSGDEDDSRSEASTPDTTVRARSISPEAVPAAINKAAEAKHAGKDVKGKGKATDSKNGAEPAWEEQESPFERLQQDMARTRLTSESPFSAASFSMPPAPAVARSNEAAALKQQELQQRTAKPATRLRDLSMDSPDFERPALETMSFQHPREKAQKPGNAADQSKAQAHNTVSHQDYRRDGSEAPSTVGKDSNSSNFYPSFDVSSASSANPHIGPSPSSSSFASSPQQHKPSLSRRQSGGNNLLLQKVLIKNMRGKDGRPTASTPARKSLKAKDLPQDLPQRWNGLADLSATPLSSFDSPQKSTTPRFNSKFRTAKDHNEASGHQGDHQQHPLIPSSASGDSLASFASTSQIGSFALHDFRPPAFSVGKSRLTKTPAKEAARLITRDALQKAALRAGGGLEDANLDSPAFEPPSVVKNWATRGYAGGALDGSLRGKQKAVSTEAGSPVVELEGLHLAPPLLMQADDADEDSFEAEFEPYEQAVPPPQPNFGHLADDGDEISRMAAKQDQPATEGVGDDWGDSFEGEEDASLDQPGIGGQDIFEETEIPVATGNDDSYREHLFDESRSFDEETLFGAKAAEKQRQRASGLGGSVQPEDAQGAGFLLRGPAAEDMVTLHGGRLLESQPFEASPLAGRDARYGL